MPPFFRKRRQHSLCIMHYELCIIVNLRLPVRYFFNFFRTRKNGTAARHDSTVFCLLIMSDTKTIFLGGHVELFLENPIKIGKIGDTDTGGYLCDLYPGRQQKIRGNIQTVVIDIFNAGHPHIFFEEAHKIMLAEINRISQFINRDIVHIVFVDIVNNRLDIFGGNILESGIPDITDKDIAEQFIEQPIDFRLEPDFKVLALFVIDRYHAFHSGADFLIMRMIRRDHHRTDIILFYKRYEIPDGAGIHTVAGQQIHIENDGTENRSLIVT